MKKLLIIDDEKVLREEIADILRFEGYDVAEADGGEDGIRKATEIMPDLIICDLMMPGIDGYGVLAQLHATDKTRSIPFIFLTAKVSRDTWRETMERGADDYLTKPINHAELLRAIEIRLNRRNALRDDMFTEIEAAKKNLTRLVAHELRTPLISINMVQDIISRKLSTLGRAELEDLLGILDSGSRRMSHLVEQMVFLTWLETHTLTPESIAVEGDVIYIWELMTATINQARRFASRQKDHYIETDYRDEQATIMGNLAALKHALAELVSNALDFSSAASSVHIAQWVVEDTIYITIYNEGDGIPADKLPDVAARYTQVDRDKNEQQGLGLGYPLAAEIVHVHGGSIQIESRVGQGTQVTIQLPHYTKPN